MVEKYESATAEAYEYATKDVMKLGLANGLMMTSFLLCYVPVILFGSYIIYNNVRDTGCDPSGGSGGNESCDPNGENVFGESCSGSSSSQVVCMDLNDSL
jgi:ATP-binding cassette, subfamily B (MDR/TAP), member 1